MNILYAGDSAVGGPANYLLGILRHLRANVTHIPPGKSLKPSVFRKHFNAIVLSDFSHRNVPAASEKKIVEQAKSGTGLLMVGGWASYSGLNGKWQGSVVEKLLPVRCLRKDDRKNVASGLIIEKKRNHPILSGLTFNPSPMICGLNEVRVREGGEVLLTARAVVGAHGCAPLRLALSTKEFPLLIVDASPNKRIAAFTTDFAPHWCGGLVDWGRQRKILKVSDVKKIGIEVGVTYIEFVSNLLLWLAREKSVL